MSKKIISVLWVLAGLVAVVLLVATIGLAVKARDQADRGVTAYLTSGSKLVILLKQPSQAGIVAAIVERGTAVAIVDAITESDQTWYHVKAGTDSGWVQAEYISLSPP